MPLLHRLLIHRLWITLWVSFTFSRFCPVLALFQPVFALFQPFFRCITADRCAAFFTLCRFCKKAAFLYKNPQFTIETSILLWYNIAVPVWCTPIHTPLWNPRGENVQSVGGGGSVEKKPFSPSFLHRAVYSQNSRAVLEKSTFPQF